jgi:hypothetical protein
MHERVRLKNKTIILASISLSLISAAASASSATFLESHCVLNPSDPFDWGWTLAGGPNAGKCLDTTQERSIYVISDGVAESFGFHPEPGLIYFANFAHDGKFWIAQLDPQGVDEAIFQIENFPAIVPAAHTEMRFKMKPGHNVQLIEQDNRGRQRRNIRDFVFSIEAVTPNDGESYGLITGEENHFALAYRFVSMADRFKDMVTIDHHKTRQLLLNLTDAEKTALLVNAVETSENGQITSYYSTLFKSCTTELFQLIDQTVPYDFGERVKIFLGSLILDQIDPPEAGIGLSARDLLKPNGQSKLADLDKDQDWLNELAREKAEP